MTLLLLKIIAVVVIIVAGVSRQVTLNRRLKQAEQNGTGPAALSPRARWLVLIAVVVLLIVLIAIR